MGRGLQVIQHSRVKTGLTIGLTKGSIYEIFNAGITGHIRVPALQGGAILHLRSDSQTTRFGRTEIEMNPGGSAEVVADALSFADGGCRRDADFPVLIRQVFTLV